MRKGIILILVLLFPSIIYLLFSLGKHHVERLGFYGDYTVEEGDTVYVPAPLPTLVDQRGALWTPGQLEGKVLVIDLFRWPCEEQCKTKMATLTNYLNKVGHTDQWLLISICLSDSVGEDVLDELSTRHLYEGGNWHFARAAEPAELDRFLEYAFVHTGRVKNISALPSDEFLLLDQGGRIRSFFDSRIYKENKKLEDAIKLLLKEPFIDWKEKP